MFVKGTEWNRQPAEGLNSSLEGAFFGVKDPVRMRKQEKPVHRLMAQMSIAGYDQKEIAEKLGFSPIAVSDVLKQPHVQAYMIEQLDESQDNFREQIIAEGKAAFARTVDLAKNSSSEKIQADLNKYLVDRFLGRAVQPIENITQPVESMSDDELRKALPELLKAQHNPEARRDSETPLSPDRVSVPEVESSPIDDFILDGQSPQTSATE